MDNVKDITEEGLQRYPNNPALIEVRARAAEELVASALGRKYAGDVEGALSLARLAREFAPGSTTAQHLVAELESMRPNASGSTLNSASSQNDAGAPLTPRWPKPGNSGSKSPPLPSATGTPVPPVPSTTPGRWL
jgi:serine/threonine-protein kinase